MRLRKVFGKGGSLYVNIPKSVQSQCGFKNGDHVHVWYVDGIGIIVSKPIKIRYVGRRVDRSVRASLDEIAVRSLPQDGESYYVMPLFDKGGRFR